MKIKNILISGVASLILATGLSASNEVQYYTNCYATSNDWPTVICVRETLNCKHEIVKWNYTWDDTQEQKERTLKMRGGVPVPDLEFNICTGEYYE